MRSAYKTQGIDLDTRGNLKKSIELPFPEGQICLEDNGKVVAVAFKSDLVDYSNIGDNHTYAQITGYGKNLIRTMRKEIPFMVRMYL